MATRKSGPPKPSRKATRSPRPRVPPGSSPVPVDDSLDALRDAATGCKRCDLWKPATKTVFGAGPDNERVLIVGEHPSDAEDLAGLPFVGPAGRMLDRALEDLGLDRRRMYVTNAVKHFKFEWRGKVRLHRSPNPGEQRACRLWLEGELARIKPDVVVCLGAIAARNVLGTKFGLMKQRGTWQVLPDGSRAFATVHPSWILRQRDSESRETAYRGFVADLALLLDT